MDFTNGTVGRIAAHNINNLIKFPSLPGAGVLSLCYCCVVHIVVAMLLPATIETTREFYYAKHFQRCSPFDCNSDINLFRGIYLYPELWL